MDQITDDINTVIPENTSGKPVDIVKDSSAKSEAEAENAFAIIRKRLMDPGCWQLLPGFTGASFAIRKALGNKQPFVENGDFLKIDIPGPGPKSGEGYDWVQVENFTEDFDPSKDNSIAFTLRASSNPDHPGKEVAHFFTRNATSTFVLTRNGSTLNLSYHGRNELPNIKEAKLSDKIRNAMVALGAMGGLSEAQWSTLLTALLRVADAN